VTNSEQVVLGHLETLPREEIRYVPTVPLEKLATVRVVDGDGLAEVDEHELPLAFVEDDVILAQVAVDQPGRVAVACTRA